MRGSGFAGAAALLNGAECRTGRYGGGFRRTHAAETNSRKVRPAHTKKGWNDYAKETQ